MWWPASTLLTAYKMRYGETGRPGVFAYRTNKNVSYSCICRCETLVSPTFILLIQRLFNTCLFNRTQVNTLRRIFTSWEYRAINAIFDS